MNIITLESCHSTWIFDPRQLRFCRILRGIAVGRPPDLHGMAPLLGSGDRPARKELHRLFERGTDPARPLFHPHTGVRGMWRIPHHRALTRGDQPLPCLSRMPRRQAGNVGAAMDDRQAREVEEAPAAPRRPAGALRRVGPDDVRRHAPAGTGPARRRRAPRGRAGADAPRSPCRTARPSDDAVRVRWTEFNLAIVVDRLGEHEAARRLWERVLAVLRPRRRPRQRAVPANRHQPGHHAPQAPPLRRRVPAAGAGARIDPAVDSAPTAAETFRAEIDLAQTHRHLGNHELALGLFTEALDRSGTKRRRPAHDPLPEVGHRHGVGGAEAIEGGLHHVRSGGRRRHRAPRARRSLPAQRRTATAGLLAPRQVLRPRPHGTSRPGTRTV